MCMFIHDSRSHHIAKVVGRSVLGERVQKHITHYLVFICYKVLASSPENDSIAVVYYPCSAIRVYYTRAVITSFVEVRYLPWGRAHSSLAEYVHVWV